MGRAGSGSIGGGSSRNKSGSGGSRNRGGSGRHSTSRTSSSSISFSSSSRGSSIRSSSSSHHNSRNDSSGHREEYVYETKDHANYCNGELVLYPYPYDNDPIKRPSHPSDYKSTGNIFVTVGILCFIIAFFTYDFMFMVAGSIFIYLSMKLYKRSNERLSPDEEKEYSEALAKYDEAVRLKNYRNKTVNKLREKERADARAEGRDIDYSRIVYPEDMQDWVDNWYVTHNSDGSLKQIENTEEVDDGESR